MKKQFISALFLFFAFLLFDSCKPEIILTPVKNKKESIGIVKSSMTLREQLMSMDVSTRKETYRNPSEEQRKTVWIEKFNIWLELPQFDSLEKIHIQNLVDFINNHSFEFSEEESQIVIDYCTDWNNYAMNVLGWSEEFTLMAVLTLFTPQEFEDAKTIKEPGGGGGGTKCHCAYSFFGCYLGGDGDTCSRDIPCEAVYGCGFLWQDRCRGICIATM